MERTLFKKLIAIVLTMLMMSSYLGLYANISVAVEGRASEGGIVDSNSAIVDENWKNYHNQYVSGYSYKSKKGEWQDRTFFYDLSKKYENLTCIRSGDGQADNYKIYDLYKLSKDSDFYKKLFGTGNDSEDNYKHLLWAIENFYTYASNDDENTRNNKLTEVMEFINPNLEQPYNFTDMVTNNVRGNDENGTFKYDVIVDSFEVTQMEQFLRFMQTQILLMITNSDVHGYQKDNFPKLYSYVYPEHRDNIPQKVQDYAKAMVNKYIKEFNPDEYDDERNINRVFKTDEDIVELEHNDDGEAYSSVSGTFSFKKLYKEASITELTVKLGNDVLNYNKETDEGDYEILVNNEVKTMKNFLALLSNANVDSNVDFKIRLKTGDIGVQDVVVDLEVDYGLITEIYVFEPILEKPEDKRQFLISYNKNSKKKNVQSTNCVKEPIMDLALTKTIIQIQDEDLDDTISLTRFTSINTEKLNTKESTDAEYIMTKSPVKVKENNIVTYEISIFNEGEVDGFAEKITDYLPEGLEFIEPGSGSNQSEINAEYGWYQDGTNKISTEYLSKNNGDDKIIQKYNGKNFVDNVSVKKVKLQCRVTAEIGAKLNNIAEISEYGYYNEDDVFVQANDVYNIDRDSKQDSVNNDFTATGRTGTLIDDIEERVNPSNLAKKYGDKCGIDYEDDDDIERLVVVAKQIDLALRKWITEVDGNKYDVPMDESMIELDGKLYDRTPVQIKNFDPAREDYYFDYRILCDLWFGTQETLNYKHQKQAVEVNPGSTVVYSIGVFNEGRIDGYAEEITDYIPEGLEFIESGNGEGQSVINAKYGWEQETNNNVKAVKTSYLSKNNETDEKKNKLSNLLKTYAEGFLAYKDTSSVRVVQIELRVKDDGSVEEGKYLTNRAEITKYGYYAKNNDNDDDDDEWLLIEANQKGIDRDSEQDTINDADGLDLENWYTNHYEKFLNSDDNHLSIPGEQDDDDFETVVVKSLPTPDIHKGVKTVENQDSGYFYKDITEEDDEEKEYTEEELEDVVHKWVVETTIEEGIEKYSKYIVTDEVQIDKLVFEGLDKVVVTRIDEEGNTLQTLTKDEDYKLSYNKQTGILKVSYIEGEFKGKFITDAEIGSLAGSKLRIEYNTTFKVVDGKLVVLTDCVQNAENQATLLYSNVSVPDKELKSEKPEVHTGAVSIFKFVDKDGDKEYNSEKDIPLEGAEFGIALTEEDARNNIFINGITAKSNAKGIAVFEGLAFGGNANSSEENLKTNEQTGYQTYEYEWDSEEVSTTYYVKETSAPDGYILSEDVYPVTISKVSTEDAINPEIAVINIPTKVPNTEKDLPDPQIHKGVKTVENQDSGYFYKDITEEDDEEKEYTEEELEDVVHKWVVETTIEEGIEKYAKYIATDEVQIDKLVFEGLDKVIVTRIDEEGNTLQTLTKDEDYKLSYNKQTGILKVSYIEGEFKGKFINDAEIGSLTGSKLRIVYNTTFKVVNGKLVVLTNGVQNAKNQATLVYNNDSNQDKELKSEIPEVHTGAVSVFKYQDTNHNGQWDEGEPSIEGAKFKIALSKEDAEQGKYITDANGKPLVATSNEQGIAIFVGLSFGGDASSNPANKQADGTYTYNWETVSTNYYIEEVYTPENYLLLDEGIVVTVSKNSTECIDLTDEITGIANQAKDGTYNFTITKKDSETNNVIEDETTTFDITVYSKLTETKEENGTKVTLDAKDVVELKNANGVTINTKGIKTRTNGKATIGQIAVSVAEIEKGTYYFVVDEVSAPDKYTEIGYKVVVPITFELVDGKYVVTHKTSEAFALVKDSKGNEYKKALKEVSTNENECSSTEQTNVTINVNVPNKPKVFDLSLRKFINKVNGKELTGKESREPQVDVSTLKKGETTAIYTHTKEPKFVSPQDIVEYVLRVYNEGELNGYASQVIDDIPDGVQMVAPTYDEKGNPTNLNAEYKWIMYKEMTTTDAKEENSGKLILRYNDKYYIETDKPEEAVIISTNYLSKENGEILQAAENMSENPNLLKAYNGGNKLDSRDLKVEFKVKPTKDTEKIITNYAQISEHQYEDGTPIADRDSTPNVWKDGEDDQDVEHIRVKWFDLALYKWVSSVIVIEDGKTSEFNTEHTEKSKDKIVNVTVAKEKLDKTVVKFKYQIKVENQGTLAGYAKEVKDHIPEGLKFVEEDNKEFGWKLEKDGTITTDYLKDTLLQPEETAEVTVVLRWINGENNLGAKINYAEISKDYNEYNAPDKDSIPDNFKTKPEEDDEDEDEVRLNVKTGSGVNYTYVLIGTVMLAIIAGGAYGVKKFVLIKE